MQTEHANLIVGYLQHTLTPEEKQAFYTWVNASPENKKLFFETKALYEACRFRDSTVDIEESWKRLLRKRVHPYSNRYKIVRYAAAIFIAVLVTSAFFLSRPQKRPIPMPAVQYISGDALQADIVLLPDGTQVSVGEKTRFWYASDYGQSKRTVFLEGEAYFDVVKDKTKPFIVKTQEQDIEVLGTQFNVCAYQEDSLVTTTLVEGSVRLTSRHNNQPVLLKPGEQIVYNRATHTGRINQVNTRQVTAWTSGYYYFHRQTLDVILGRLEHIYGVHFTIQSEELNKRSFTGTFYKGQSLESILEIINLSIPIRYQITGKDIYLAAQKK